MAAMLLHHASAFIFGQNGDDERMLVISISLFVSLICLCILLGHLLEGSRWLNESIIAITIGCIAGVISNYFSGSVLQFNEELLFIYFLPPIIFYAGFQVKKKQFFHNFGTIVLFGGLGVFVSAIVISLGCSYLFPWLKLGDLQSIDYLAIGVIFSATDTVATLQMIHQDESPLLYSIVFGEGVVNDAAAVVLFRAIQRFRTTSRPFNSGTALNMMLNFSYLFSSSTLLGIAAGLLTAYLLKKLYLGRHSTDREISLMALVAYLSYTLSEVFQLSGILTAFFCGIIMSHYAWHNLSDSSRVTTKHAFATMAYVSETFMFLYVGSDVLNMDKWQLADKRSAFIICGILLVLTAVGRAAFVFPFSCLSNYVRGVRSSRLSFRYQVIIWWAGLIRGSVTIALAYSQFGSSATMICATISVVFMTTVVLGVVTKSVVRALLSTEEAPSPSKREYQALDGGPPNLRRRSSLTLLLTDPTLAVHNFWRNFDDLYMRPVFGGGEAAPAPLWDV